MAAPRCCYFTNGLSMWGRSRTHFPTDDIWKPSRLAWIKAGIKGFSRSPPWTGRELCTRWGKTMHLPQSWGLLAGVSSPHLLCMTENCLCIFRTARHCRWMIMQQHLQQYTEACYLFVLSHRVSLSGMPHLCRSIVVSHSLSQASLQ